MSSVLLQSPAVVAVFAESTATPSVAGSAEAEPLNAAFKTLIGWLQQHYGIWGIVVAAVVLIWWQWSKIKELPGVTLLAGWFKDRAIRGKRLVISYTGNKPRGDRFALAIARLINDNESGDSKTLIREELKTEFPGIEVLDVDSEINDDDVEVGHEGARDILRLRKADAILWGRVLRHDVRRVPKLYLTVSPDDALNKVGNYSPTEDLKLPELFWDDLKEVFRLVVATAAAKFDAAITLRISWPRTSSECVISWIRNGLGRSNSGHQSSTSWPPPYLLLVSSLGTMNASDSRSMPTGTRCSSTRAIACRWTGR
jgi:hypothetical protein